MRLIDADALVEAMGEEPYTWTDSAEEIAERNQWLTDMHIIESAPSIDIEPKRGEWKPFDLKWGRSIWYCTACEEGVEVPCDIWTHKPIYNYCPNCGADMREREDERDYL